MAYPGLRPNAIPAIVHDRVERQRTRPEFEQRNLHADIADHLITIPTTENVDRQSFDEELEQVRTEIEDLIRGLQPHTAAADQMEGKAAIILFEALDRLAVPTPVLDDQRFWAYVTIAHLWNFVIWRHRRTYAKQVDPQQPQTVDDEPEENSVDSSGRNFLVYVDGRRSSECVGSRMYLRVCCVGGSFYSEYSSRLRQATDFWRSHVLRVKQGSFPAVVRTMVELQTSDRLTRDPLRKFASNLNYEMVNFEFGLLEDEEQARVVERLWIEQVLAQANAAVS